jgi:TM2 domain-containing membrane protein YozV
MNQATITPASRISGDPQGAGQSGRLTDAKRMLIEQRISNEKPSAGVAYLLCFFLGVFGAHRLYLGQRGTGIVMLILGLTFFGWIISGPWAFIDLFLIPSIIQRKVDGMRQKLTIDAIA